ncbi:MAG TPA: hypothetical protein VIJ75_17980, partial [Hanamia sp.]
MQLKSKIKSTFLAVFVVAVLGSVVTGCDSGSSNKSTSTDSTATSGSADKTLLGAGSTFVYPLFSKQFSEYNKLNGLQINYQA